MRTSCRTWLAPASAFLLGGLAALLAPAAVQAAPMPEFTGYTRIGYPPSGAKIELKAEDGDKAKMIGLTIYFMVLDRQKAKENDTWGIGTKDFDMSFVSGKNSDRTKLDTSTRYLYLYQVINDSGRPAVVKDLSIRLVIDPRLITSWGHFSERGRKGQAIRGIGFSMPTGDKDLIRPLSTDFPGVSDREYTTPAPARRAPKIYGITPISIGEVPAAAGEDVGKEPEAVLIVPNAYLGGAPGSG